MKNIFLYFLTFLAVVLPIIWYQVLSDRKPRQEKKKEQESSLPFIFQLCARPAEFLNLLGVGYLFRRLSPVSMRELQKKLSYAGLVELSPERVCCTRCFLVIFLSVASASVAWMIVPPDQKLSIPVAAVIAVFIAWVLPGAAVDNHVQTRRTRILQAIPFSIDLICSAMRGGLDFTAAIRFYVKLQIPGPLTEEYSAMLREMELGVIRTEAIQNMAERIQIKEFTSFAAAIVMGTELGASLADTMEIQSEEMRKLRFSIAECKAQRAPSLMLIPMALFILPAVFIVILTPVFLKMKEAGVPLF